MKTLLILFALLAYPDMDEPEAPEEKLFTVIENCIDQEDTKHIVFHGCIDWHSAVHAHWAELWLCAYLGMLPKGESLLNNISSKEIDKEIEFLKKKSDFEMPYGRAWALQLDKTARNYYSDTTFTPLARYCFATLMEYTKKEGGSPLSSRYENSSWYLYQMHQWATLEKDTTAQKLIQKAAQKRLSQVEEWPTVTTITGFFEPKMLALLLIEEVKLDSSFWQPIQKVIDEEPAAPVDYMQHPHMGGLNYSRSWGLSALHRLTHNPVYLQQSTELIEYMQERLPHWSKNYQWYGHWVAQFGTFARMQNYRK